MWVENRDEINGAAHLALTSPSLPVLFVLQRDVLNHLPRPPPKLSKVPRGTPVRKSWHVERRRVTEKVFEALRSGGMSPQLVGLVGDSESGKTTAAFEIVRSPEVLEAFSDGIVWLSVDAGAKDRLPSLILQLARTVFEGIGGSEGDPPKASDDGAAYVKQYMERGHGGEGFKCLLVGDNVWEKELVSKLLETGMWVLLTSRDKVLVSIVDGEAVGVAELSKADAESVLRGAAELPLDVHLPDDAVDLIELCGRVAMDLAFVGRWSDVRRTQDRPAWSDAAEKIRAAMGKIGDDSRGGMTVDARATQRKAILQAGFEELAIGSDDERVQRLYPSLAVLPVGHAFILEDAATLLYDEPTPEDEASVREVVDILERWTVVRSTEGTFRTHDAHSDFTRETLMDRGYVRRPALKRWVSYISSLHALRSIDTHVLKGLWLAVGCVSGDGRDKIRPYEAAVVAIDESDHLLREIRRGCRMVPRSTGGLERSERRVAQTA